ncbi:hypothetical protein GCM10009069_05120 [Algimonas arctica]|uniref:Uncharacterized protein n=1 Tax=Algimonas arctica TaxID=1479486 RepID=A0A8J3CM62_9PROT|nr:hypothetical protein [Algimonas arctica]GHA84980.1 hypothetical protein GCM10009069_05120 [Algimonas arctica]
MTGQAKVLTLKSFDRAIILLDVIGKSLKVEAPISQITKRAVTE